MTDIFDPLYYVIETVDPDRMPGHKREIIDFFKKVRYPDDNQVHRFAKELDITPEELEREIYQMFSDLLQKVGEF